jgi:metal-responsive CopG/Arc/MetJ family transcriptional regulator
MQSMDEKRSVKVSIMLTPFVAAQLDAYAKRFRWSRSNAVAVLVEAGLKEEEESGELEG